MQSQQLCPYFQHLVTLVSNKGIYLTQNHNNNLTISGRHRERMMKKPRSSESKTSLNFRLNFWSDNF